VLGAGGEGLVQAAAGHERVHQAGLLSTVVSRQAVAQEWHNVRVAVDAQDRHLPQELGKSLERGLAQKNVRSLEIHASQQQQSMIVRHRLRDQ
jgi:hypothetical protein